MKAVKLLIFFFFLVTSLKSQVKFSSINPEAGRDLSFTYDPKGTALENEQVIKCNVFSFVSLIPKITTVILEKKGAMYHATISTGDSTNAVALSFYAGHVKDLSPNGYDIKLDHQGKTTAEAYAMEAYILDQYNFYHITGHKNDEKSVVAYNQAFILKPALKKEFIADYLPIVYRVNKEAGLQLFNENLQRIGNTKSTNEKDLNLVWNFYHTLGNEEAADSVKNILLQYYPTGRIAINLTEVDLERTSNTKLFEDKLNAMIVKFSLDSMWKHHPKTLENYYARLAIAYAGEKNEDKFDSYMAKISDNMIRATTYNTVAWQLAKKNENLAFAAEISRKALLLITAAKKQAVPSSMPENEYLDGIMDDYLNFNRTYSLILFDLGKYNDAITYFEKSMPLSQKSDPELIASYITYLKADGQFEKAFVQAELLIREGNASEAVLADFKMLYTKLGKKRDYMSYLSKLEEASTLKEKDEWLKKMTNIPAPDFSLMNLKGEKVSLSDFKGKIVILDYWATWCGPCKLSFPGMQKAIDKYRANPNIVFLFIDTWQNEATTIEREKAVRDYINTTKYTFNILLDTPEKQNNSLFNVVSRYKVAGIPAKFLIDGKGNIRFQLEGYAGSDEGVVKEIDTMISLTANQMETAKAK